MTPEPESACRADLWLWRARLFKTRALAALACEAGRLRLARAGGVETRLDKPSRTLRPGDRLVFAEHGRLVAVRIQALGWRRGPPAEARALYMALEVDAPDTLPNDAIPEDASAALGSPSAHPVANPGFGARLTPVSRTGVCAPAEDRLEL